MKNQKLLGVLQLLLGSILFGFVPLFVRLGESTTTASLVFFRAFFGMLSLYLLMKILKKPLARFTEQRWKIIPLSFCLALSILFYFLALKLIDIASAVLLLYTYPSFIVLLSWLWLKERICINTLVALLFSLLGVIFVVSPVGFTFQNLWVGYLIALGCGFLVALNFILFKRYFQTYDVFSLTFYQSLWQLPFLLPFVLFSPPSFVVRNILIFIGLGFVCSALTFLLVYSGSQKVPAQYIGILQTAEILVAVLWGILLFHETPAPRVLLGGAFLIASYLFVSLKKS